jgi:hypothetical protein
LIAVEKKLENRGPHLWGFYVGSTENWRVYFYLPPSPPLSSPLFETVLQFCPSCHWTPGFKQPLGLSFPSSWTTGYTTSLPDGFLHLGLCSSVTSSQK